MQDLTTFDLFGEKISQYLPIGQVAKEVGVSEATIRNWIKTGYLKSPLRGQISRDSLAAFIAEVAGKDKLNARANKSQKELHDHGLLQNQFAALLSHQDGSAEILAKKYEESLSESHRNLEGIYYTPIEIVKDMLKDLRPIPENATFLDPCCGSGNFLLGALDHGFKLENIYGFDTDETAVMIARRRIYERTGIKPANIFVGDFLDIASNLNQEFQYIFTNPPWGKKIAKAQREALSYKYGGGKSYDTCSLFLYAAFSRISKAGQIGFLLPESFFNVSAFQDARALLLNQQILRLIDYGKPFKGLVTKAQAVTFSRSKPSAREGTISCQLGTRIHSRTKDSFSSMPGRIFNFWIDADGERVIRRAYEVTHVTLKESAAWALGIVTGNNEKFCREQPADGYIPVYKGSDIANDNLKPASAYIPENLDLYQQVAPKHLYDSNEKIVYKFISSKLCFFLDTERRYFLNSANMLILNQDFPLTGRQLCDLLNSEFMNWLFQNIFNTHKVLRGDLEALPIHAEFFQLNPVFHEDTYLNFLGIQRANNGTYRIKA